MSFLLKKWLLVAIVSLCCGMMILVVKNLIFFFKSKRIRRSRKSDRPNLRQLFDRKVKTARALALQGKLIQAARIFESVGQNREAITCLENGGMIDEAAEILVRMNKPNRAGVIFARHGRWEKAAKCFRLAQMPLEVARCEREAGQFKTASDFFIIANRPTEAAECFLELGEFHKAAKFYGSSGNELKALELYHRLLENTDDIRRIDFEPKEIELITKHVAKGSDHGLAAILVKYGRLAESVLALCRGGQLNDAVKVYAHTTEDISEQLIKDAADDNSILLLLAEVFSQSSNYMAAAGIFEKMGEFEKASLHYELAEDPKGVERCDQRRLHGGKKTKAKAKPESDKTNVIEFSEAKSALKSAQSKGSKFNNQQETLTGPAPDLEILRQCELFAGCALPDVEALFGIGRIKVWPKDKVFSVAPSEMGGLFVVLSGKVSTTHHDNEQKGLEKDFGRGEFFGAEIALLGHSDSMAIKVVEQSRLYFIKTLDFERFCDLNGKFSRQVYKNFTSLQVKRSVKDSNHKKNQKVS